MANDKLKELEQRLFELEKAFDKNLIDFETYIRQRSLLLMKKSNAEERRCGKESQARRIYYEQIIKFYD